MIPAFVNALGGSATDARSALDEAECFDVHEVRPDALSAEIEGAVSRGASRIAVAGGDGTIATAAAVLAGTPTELALVPGGTLNHFARDNGIPTELPAAVAVARDGRVVAADAAYAGDRLFLNTSSVGAYVTFVRLRERLEPSIGYRLASLVAVMRLLLRLRPVHLQLEVDGVVRSYRTPLVFIGVGERECRIPLLGGRVEGGSRALHVLVVREKSAARLLLVALAAVALGIRHEAATPDLDAFLVDRCTIDLHRPRASVSLDGEIVTLPSPLEYRIERGALRIVVPRPSQQ